MTDQPTDLLNRLDRLAQDSVGNYGLPIAAEAAAELRRLHAENQSLAEFVRAVGGIWTEKTKSVLVGEFSLAASINRATDEEQRDTTLLRQAMNALINQRGEPDFQNAMERESVIAALRERLGVKA